MVCNMDVGMFCVVCVSKLIVLKVALSILLLLPLASINTVLTGIVNVLVMINRILIMTYSLMMSRLHHQALKWILQQSTVSLAPLFALSHCQIRRHCDSAIS